MPGFGTAAEAFNGLSSAVGGTVTRFTSLTVAAKDAAIAIDGVEAKMRTLASAAQVVRDAVAAAGGGGGPVNQHSGDAAVVAKLSDLEARIRSVYGPNAYFAAVIQERIDQVNAGNQSAADAVQYIRDLFQVYASGLMQDALSSNPAMRALALELQQLIASGIFQ